VSILEQLAEIYTSVSGIGSAGGAGTLGAFLRLLWLRPHDVDRCGVKVRLDVRRIVSRLSDEFTTILSALLLLVNYCK
jgi:hypothetical protein